MHKQIHRAIFFVLVTIQKCILISYHTHILYFTSLFVCMSHFEEQNLVITDQILIKSLKNLIFCCVALGH